MSVRDIEARIAEGDRARRQGEYPVAETAYREALRMADGEYADNHLAKAEVLCKLGRLYESMGRGLDSTLSFRECLRIFSSVSGDEYFELAVARDRRAVPTN